MHKAFHARNRGSAGSRAVLGPVLFASGLGALAAGCGDDGTLPQALAAEEVRELDLLADVEVVAMTREQFAAQAEERAANIDEAALVQYAETYGRLGYFDTSLDLRPIIAGSSSEWVGATYSPARKVVTLVGEARDDVIVHEFVHALQDQHFDLVAYDVSETSDAFLARRAVVEGDATLAQYRFVAREEGLELDGVNWAGVFESWRGYSDETLAASAYPVVFLDYVSFVYSYGLEYTAANLVGVTLEAPAARPAPHDWGLEDQLFAARPPASTRQILNLDLDGASPPPVEIGLREPPDELAERLRVIDWDTLGTWYVYLLLYPLTIEDGTTDEIRALAAAWRGDRVLFVRDATTGEAAAIWASAWADESAAGAMLEALRRLYGASEPAQGLAFAAADGEMVWLEQRGDALVAAKNVADDVAPALLDAAFLTTVSRAPRRRPSLAATLARLRRARDLECANATPGVRPALPTLLF